MYSLYTEERASLPDVKVLAVLGGFEVDQGWEQQDHVSTFIHNGCSAVGAADLAWQLVHTRLFGALVPAKVVLAFGEVDVVLVEDCCPLKGSALGFDQRLSITTGIESVEP